MRRLLRSKSTRLFLSENGEWTPIAAKAKSFSDWHQALQAIETLKLADAELYCSLNDAQPEFDFVVPLCDSKPSLFLTETGDWTPVPVKAKLFPDTMQALDAIKKLKLSRAELSSCVIRTSPIDYSSFCVTNR